MEHKNYYKALDKFVRPKERVLFVKPQIEGLVSFISYNSIVATIVIDHENEDEFKKIAKNNKNIINVVSGDILYNIGEIGESVFDTCILGSYFQFCNFSDLLLPQCLISSRKCVVGMHNGSSLKNRMQFLLNGKNDFFDLAIKRQCLQFIGPKSFSKLCENLSLEVGYSIGMSNDRIQDLDKFFIPFLTTEYILFEIYDDNIDNLNTNINKA